MHYNFDLDLKDGEFGEQIVSKILRGRIEVKTDYSSHQTGNIVVEVESRGRPSGLSTTEAKFWMFVLYHEKAIITVPTWKLKRLISGRETVMGGDNKTSRLVLIPKNELVNNFWRG
jgi:hypothetical protein